MQRIRQLKVQQFEEALRAKTGVQIQRRVPQDASKTQAAPVSNTDPTAVYKERLAQLKGAGLIAHDDVDDASQAQQERSPRKFVLVAALALGLGFLMKGPVGVIIPLLVIVPVLVIERRSIGVTPIDLVLGFVVFMAVAVPWYFLMWLRHGNEYLQSFFVGDNFERFATDRFNDPRPWWFYVPVVAGGLLPWTPLALVWLGPITQFVRFTPSS